MEKIIKNKDKIIIALLYLTSIILGYIFTKKIYQNYEYLEKNFFNIFLRSLITFSIYEIVVLIIDRFLLHQKQIFIKAILLTFGIAFLTFVYILYTYCANIGITVKLSLQMGFIMFAPSSIISFLLYRYFKFN